jgi:hypothetical protein
MHFLDEKDESDAYGKRRRLMLVNKCRQMHQKPYEIIMCSPPGSFWLQYQTSHYYTN